MSLDDQLRSALVEESDRRSIPRPDIERMISGGRVRRRRRDLARLGAVTVAVVLLGGGAYGITQLGSADPPTDPGITDQPSRPTTGTPQPYRDIDAQLPEPGTYRKLVGIDEDSGARFRADLTFRNSEWYSGAQPVLVERDASGSESAVGVAIFQAQTLAGGSSGCTADGWQPVHTRKAADTAEAVGRQLVRLPRSTVLQPLAHTEAFGYQAVHLALRVDGYCGGGEIYLVAESDTGHDWGITYSAVQKVVMDVLVLDIPGNPTVIAAWHHPKASPELVAEATRVRDSISFVTD